MKSFFRRNRPESAEIKQAQAATTRANDTIDLVNSRAPEVEKYYQNLRQRRLQNNFGDALALAMERRTV
jgi:hypothetical protein